MTDLVLRNNENRPSLTSGAAAVAERQQASSKNTISAHGPPTTPGPQAPHHLNPALQRSVVKHTSSLSQ